MSAGKEISENIKRFRELKKMTQEALAKKSGVKIGTIANYEAGSRRPKIENLGKIAEALGVHVSDIDSVCIQNELSRRRYGMGKDEEPIVRHKYRVVSLAQAAGFDPTLEPIDDLIRLSDDTANFETPPGPGLFAVRVEGDSMDPMIPDGTSVLVKADALPRSGKPCLAKIRATGQVVCKVWWWRNGTIELRSLHPDGDNYSWTKEEFQRDNPILWRVPIVEYSVKVKW